MGLWVTSGRDYRRLRWICLRFHPQPIQRPPGPTIGGRCRDVRLRLCKPVAWRQTKIAVTGVTSLWRRLTWRLLRLDARLQDGRGGQAVGAPNLKRLRQAFRPLSSRRGSDAGPPLAYRADDVFEAHLMSPG